MSRWFRWYAGSCEDGKFRIVAQQSNVTVAAVMGLWAALLEDASDYDHRGVAVRGHRYFEVILGLSAQDLDLILSEMRALKLIQRRGEKITITKWKNRQFETDKTDGTNAERQKRWRNAHKTDRNGRVTDYKTGTKRPDTDTDTDTDTESEKKGRESRPKSSRKRSKTQFPEGFELTEERKIVASKHGIDSARVPSVFEHFRDHHTSKGNVFADWDAAWRTWCSRDPEFHQKTNGTSHGKRTDLQLALDKLGEYARSGDQPEPSIPESGPTRRGG